MSASSPPSHHTNPSSEDGFDFEWVEFDEIKNDNLEAYLDQMQRDLKHYLQTRYIDKQDTLKSKFFPGKKLAHEFTVLLFSKQGNLSQIMSMQPEIEALMAGSPNSFAAVYAMWNWINQVKQLQIEGMLTSIRDFASYEEKHPNAVSENPVIQLAAIANELFSQNKTSSILLLLQHHAMTIANSANVLSIIDTTFDNEYDLSTGEIRKTISDQLSENYQRAQSDMLVKIRHFIQIHQKKPAEKFQPWLENVERDIKLYLQHKYLKNTAKKAGIRHLFSLSKLKLTPFEILLFSEKSSLEAILTQAETDALTKKSLNSKRAIFETYVVIKKIDALFKKGELQYLEDLKTKSALESLVTELSNTCKQLREEGRSQGLLPMIEQACVSLATMAGTMTGEKIDFGQYSKKKNEMHKLVDAFSQKHADELATSVSQAFAAAKPRS